MDYGSEYVQGFDTKHSKTANVGTLDAEEN